MCAWSMNIKWRGLYYSFLIPGPSVVWLADLEAGEDAVVAKTHTKSSRPLVGRPASLAHARRRTLDFPPQMFPSSLMQREAPTPNRPWAEPQQFKTSSFRRPESHGAPHYPLYTSPLCSFLAHESHSNKQQPKPSLARSRRPADL
jgi:hypothetical protein